MIKNKIIQLLLITFILVIISGFKRYQLAVSVHDIYDLKDIKQQLKIVLHYQTKNAYCLIIS